MFGNILIFKTKSEYYIFYILFHNKIETYSKEPFSVIFSTAIKSQRSSKNQFYFRRHPEIQLKRLAVAAASPRRNSLVELWAYRPPRLDGTPGDSRQQSRGTALLCNGTGNSLERPASHLAPLRASLSGKDEAFISRTGTIQCRSSVIQNF